MLAVMPFMPIPIVLLPIVILKVTGSDRDEATSWRSVIVLLMLMFASAADDASSIVLLMWLQLLDGKQGVFFFDGVLALG